MYYSPVQLQAIQKELDTTTNQKSSNLKNVAVGLRSEERRVGKEC